LPSTYKLFSY